MASALLWLLLSFDISTMEMTAVARYTTSEECEIGRVQYEMQHVVMTECIRNG